MKEGNFGGSEETFLGFLFPVCDVTKNGRLELRVCLKNIQETPTGACSRSVSLPPFLPHCNAEQDSTRHLPVERCFLFIISVRLANSALTSRLWHGWLSEVLVSFSEVVSVAVC